MSDPKDAPEATIEPAPNGRSEAAPPAAELEQLKKRAEERDTYLDLAKRTQAEFENYQKRSRRDREQERQGMTSALMLDLLPTLDNLERAIDAAQKAQEKGPLVQGVLMVKAQFLDLLKRHGVTPIEAQGKPFDPNLHQAVTQVPAQGAAPNVVLQVIEPGYLIQDRVLRPAKVVVSA